MIRSEVKCNYALDEQYASIEKEAVKLASSDIASRTGNVLEFNIGNADRPGVRDEDPPVGATMRWRKRLLDIAGAIGLLLVFSPLMGVLYLLVRRDGGAAIFAHTRIGRNGVPFTCYKFRSMVPNASQLLAEILTADPEASEEWKANHKLEKDPRITPLGSFLRRKSLDELPQLFNVLKGDMSLVGPRPITPDEICRYGDWVSYYYAGRPGLTGAWQVSGRNNLPYDERVRLDVEYARNWSLLTDIRILLKTVRTVLTGEGAQ